jgi:hypothetical protein
MMHSALGVKPQLMIEPRVVHSASLSKTAQARQGSCCEDGGAGALTQLDAFSGIPNFSSFSER